MKKPMKLSRKDWQGVKIFAGIFIVILVGFIIGLWIVLRYPPTDPHTLCYTEKSFSTHHIMLVDTTDRLSTFQTTFLSNKVDEVVSASDVMDRFSVFTVDSEIGGISRPEFDMCKPDDGKKLNRLYQNPELARAKFDKRFYLPLMERIRGLSEQEPQNTSPITESVSDLDRLRFYDVLATEIRLYVFSDLLQNSRKISVYRGDQIPDSRSCAGEKKESNVFLYALERPESEEHQDNELYKNWASFFGSCMEPGKQIAFEKVRN